MSSVIRFHMNTEQSDVMCMKEETAVSGMSEKDVSKSIVFISTTVSGIGMGSLVRHVW